MRSSNAARALCAFLLLTGLAFAAWAPPILASSSSLDPTRNAVKELLRRFDNLPDGWRLRKHTAVPEAGFAPLGKKIGAEILALTNDQLQTPYGVIRVNLIMGASDGDAERLHRAMLEVHKGNQLAVKRDGRTVVEFVANDIRPVREAAIVLGFEPRDATYRVGFQLAPLRKGNPADVNVAFNLLIRLAANPDDTETRKRVEEYRDQFEFGRSIQLRLLGADGKPGDWSVTPDAARRESWFHDDVVAYEFGDLPERAGVPYATVEGTVRTSAFAITPSDRKKDVGLTAATTTWPSEDESIRALASEIVGDAKTVPEKVERLLAWHRPGTNLNFGGRDTGSRHGFGAFHERKLGHCWDFSDSFITLARAVDVPCRQVAGWVDGMGGHVWAEVLREGEGWRQVDPTANGGCDATYVPFFTTEDGTMSVFYLAIPTIEKL